ncbi:MAG TPA: PGPGW domain-containing protein [Candidatus Binataceae bacterium]|nr:PGPGW domain-containing protein [Candidatus Binataceae bacterium]
MLRSANGLWPQTVRQARRFVFLLIGSTLIAFGIVMLVTPGPGWLLIFAGLSVLAVEFAWARRLLKRIKAKAGRLVQGRDKTRRDKPR